MCNLLFSEKINIVCPHRYLLAMLICYHTGELTSGYIREDFTCYSEHFTEVSALKTFSLLGIYPEDIPTGKKDTCSTMFIAALFILARCWKEPRCPSTEKWIQKMWYIYTTELLKAMSS